MVDRETVQATLGSLTHLERQVLEKIPRLAKTEDNTFREHELLRKLTLTDIDQRGLKEILKSLTGKRIIYKRPRGCWRTTELGRIVAHEVFKQYLLREHPDLTPP